MHLFPNKTTGDHLIWTHSCRETRHRDDAWIGIRWWMHITLSFCFNVEFYWLGHNRWLAFDIGTTDDDPGFRVSIGIWRFTLHLSVESWKLFRWVRRCNLGFRTHSGSIWVDLFDDDHGSDSLKGKSLGYRLKYFWKHGVHFCLPIVDWLLGKEVYTKGEGEEHIAILPMPEGNYPVTITLSTDTWVRPRWPGVKRVKRARIVPSVSIPVPGKGESSWDCDEDAWSNMTCAAASIPEALTHAFESTIRDRFRHGSGTNWKPVDHPCPMPRTGSTDAETAPDSEGENP